VIVVDASVLATALVDDRPHGDQARSRLLGESLVAPELIDLEVVSAIRSVLRRGLIDGRRAQLALTDLVALDAQRVPHRNLLPRVWELRDNLTPYDAVYVALAELIACTLVTADERLARSPGPRCPIELITIT
jgi:predicted nucleic acid-binding protein